MSVEALAWAFRQKLPGKPKIVLLALADQADDVTGHVCYGRVDVKHLSKKASIAERSFYRYVAALVRNGYMVRESGQEKGMPNQFWVCLDRAPTPIDNWVWKAGESEPADENDDPQDVEEGSAILAEGVEPEMTRQSGIPPAPIRGRQESSDNINTSKAREERKQNSFSKAAQDVERGLAPTGSGWYDRTSREARAIRTLCQIVGREDHFDNVMGGARTVCYQHEITPQLIALADAPPRAEWVRLAGQQLPAWFGFAKKSLPNLRIKLDSGARAPWPWPPRKDGTIGTGPPDALADEDVAELKKTG